MSGSAHPDLHPFRLDSLGFPAVVLPSLGLACHLLPATKVQYEYYLGDTPEADAGSYSEMLAACPRASWRTCRPGAVEGTLVAAARPTDAILLARWLGDEYRLPTADEWRHIDAALDRPADPARLRSDPDLHPCAAALLAAGIAGARWRQLGLFDGGLLEWVSCPDGGFGLYGRPPTRLFRTTHNPQRDDPLKLVSDARHPAIGFRLVYALAAEGRP